MKTSFLLFVILVISGPVGCSRQQQRTANHDANMQWARGIVWYQIFPERFRNGDPASDPEAAEVPWAEFQKNWQIHPWTSDWYKLQPWERTHSYQFYEVVYQRRFGGDLAGVIQKLDYLKELGVDAIYFNPLFEAESLHKYDGSNFHHIDDNFGPSPKRDKERLAGAQETDDPATWIWTGADSLFLTLIREAHRRNIKIVIDGVFNHTGTAFFAFRDLREHGASSRYADWYDVSAWDDPDTDEDEFDYKGWWGNRDLPEFKETETGIVSGPRSYIYHCTRRWMDPNGDGIPSDGVDGWRLDVADEISPLFWRDWNIYVKSINPAAITVAEIWRDAAEFIRDGKFDGAMNYPFAFSMADFFMNKEKSISGHTLGERLDHLVRSYGQDTMQVIWNLVESHDTERLASMILNPDRRGFDRDGSLRDNPDFCIRKPDAGGRRIQKQVAAFQMTFIGAPMIYYGTEAGMWGADDPDDRKPMLWGDLIYENEATHPVKGKSRPADTNQFDHALFTFYQKLIDIRHRHQALMKGSYRTLHSAVSEDTFGFLREDNRNQVICLFNRKKDPVLISLDANILRSGNYLDVLTLEQLALTASDPAVEIDENGFRILVSVGE